MENKKNFLKALGEWEGILPNQNIISQSQASAEYGKTTFGFDRSVLATLIFDNIEQLIQATKIAFQNKVPIYPISTGNNWGYGSSAPVENNCVIFDLSKLDEISVCDSTLGIFRVQPGVTFKKLFLYLKSNNYKFLVPTIGGGPDCSIIGNILERGYGTVPFSDHFSIATSFRVILPNGELYETPLSLLGGDLVDASYKWGVGPYIDGIFTQGAYGIIFEITICLKPISPVIRLITFTCAEHQLKPLIDTLQKISSEFGNNLSSIKVMNQRSCLASSIKYPKGVYKKNRILTEEHVDAICSHFKIKGKWQGIIAIYGSKKFTKTIQSSIINLLKPQVKQIASSSSERNKALYSIMSRSRFLQKLPGYKKIFFQRNIFELLEGLPSIATLNFVYWFKKNNTYELQNPNPQKDGCGLIWFSPLAPFKGDKIYDVIKIIKSICEKYNIEPLISLISLSSYCMDISVPLLFEKENAEAQNRAYNCYLELFNECKIIGCIPCRMNINTMHLIVEKDKGYWNVVEAFKKAIDPHNIISPGRYAQILPKSELVRNPA
jgi:4-cresol dehydrogenase (hydroxylating)